MAGEVFECLWRVRRLLPETKPGAPGERVFRELVFFTPEYAKGLLHRNSRPLDPNIVTNLARQMSKGAFCPELSAIDPIVMDNAGVVLCGQHRCAAIVESGQSYWLHVRRKAEKKRATLPQDARRRVGPGQDTP